MMRKIIFLGVLLQFLVFSPAYGESVTENNGFILSNPYINTKRIFVVTPSDRLIVDVINSASNSVSAFLIEINNAQYNYDFSSIRHICPGSFEKLRLPPLMSGSVTRRYVAVAVYNWKIIDVDRISFLIDFVDAGSPKNKYIESYIFLRKGEEWFFESHGNIQP